MNRSAAKGASKPAIDPRITSLIDCAERLADAVETMRFAPPVSHVYNPLRYAWRPHVEYLTRSRPDTTRVLFLGMNPGPWGMAQTGVPFGQVAAVRDWIGIDLPVDRPANEHPKRPIDGFSCNRSEVSGARLWGLFKERFSTPAAFFREHFVANYCPLVFMESSGRNRTPDKLPRHESAVLQRACDEHLCSVIRVLRPRFLVGVGSFAEQCFHRVFTALESADRNGIAILRILHPSPASPAANRDWAVAATAQLVSGGVWDH